MRKEFNSGSVFVRDPRTGQFLLEKDLAEKPAEESLILSQKPLGPGEQEYQLADGACGAGT